VAAVMFCSCAAALWRYGIEHERPTNLGVVRTRMDTLRASLERKFGPL
jgi:hypothetical protein